MNYIKPNILPGCQTFHSDKGQPSTHAALSDRFPAPTLGGSRPPENSGLFSDLCDYQHSRAHTRMMHTHSHMNHDCSSKSLKTILS